MEITVTYTDGRQQRLPAGTTALEALKTSGAPKGVRIVAAEVNGQLVDLSRALGEDSQVAPVAADSADGTDVLRHSAAHLMAQAVKRLFSPES